MNHTMCEAKQQVNNNLRLPFAKIQACLDIKPKYVNIKWQACMLYNKY